MNSLNAGPDNGNSQATIAANILMKAPVTGTSTFVMLAGANIRLVVTGTVSGNDTV